MATVLNRAACHRLAALHCAARASNRGTAARSAQQCTAHAGVLLKRKEAACIAGSDDGTACVDGAPTAWPMWKSRDDGTAQLRKQDQDHGAAYDEDCVRKLDVGDSVRKGSEECQQQSQWCESQGW